MAFSLNYSKICRTCLSEDFNLKSIFSMEHILEHVTSLSDILKACASVQVSKDDGLPQNVCVNCAQEMSRAYVFRKLCEKSDSTLRAYLDINLCHSEEQNHQHQESYCTDITDHTSTENNCSNETDTDTSNNEDTKYDENQGTLCKEIRDENLMQFSCKSCNEYFTEATEYETHMSEKHVKTYFCDTCEQRFKTQESFKYHKCLTNRCKAKEEGTKVKVKKMSGITRKRNLPRTCDICSKTFRFHSNLERHRLIHTGEKPYLCNVCGKGFGQMSYLKIHSFIHTGEKPYKCELCDKGFAAPGTLMTHMRTHTGERPHVCKICGKDFPQSGYLSAHVRTHTGEKPMECKVCQRRFNQSGRLIIHMRIHSGEKPYSCKDCGRCFAVKGTLKKHIRTHTGERPYICSSCGQAFAQSGTLATHMKVHRTKSQS